MPVISLLSMAVFAVVQSAVMGIALGVGITLLLLIHEIGHVVALKRRGYPIKLPFFIPFVGAAIAAPKFTDRNTEAYVGYGGPFIGTAASMICLIPYLFTGEQFWLLLSAFGVFINLFNMIPLSPLDGGRITQAVSKYFKWFGIGALLLFTLGIREPGMLLVWIACIVDMHSIKLKRRLQYCILIWLLMIGLTAAGMGKNLVVNITDIVLGLILFVFPAGVYLRRKARGKQVIEIYFSVNDIRPTLPSKHRFAWFMAWTGLLVFQVVAIILMFAEFPTPEK